MLVFRQQAKDLPTIIKKGQFSNLELLEIYQKINNEQDSNTVQDTSIINKMHMKWFRKAGYYTVAKYTKYHMKS